MTEFTADQKTAVGLEAYGRVSAQWALSAKEAAALVRLSEADMTRAQDPHEMVSLTGDQTLRL